MGIARIKEAVSLPAVAAEYATLKRSGPIHVCVCLWHDDSRPSCYIYQDHYHCHVCGAHGDVIDWVAKYEGLSKGRAIRLLSQRTGIPLDGRPMTRRERQSTLEEQPFALWWQKEYAVDFSVLSEEESEAAGIILRQVKALKGADLRALVIRVATEADRERWRAWKQHCEDVTWMCVEALSLA